MDSFCRQHTGCDFAVFPCACVARGGWVRFGGEPPGSLSFVRGLSLLARRSSCGSPTNHPRLDPKVTRIPEGRLGRKGTRHRCESRHRACHRAQAGARRAPARAELPVESTTRPIEDGAADSRCRWRGRRFSPSTWGIARRARRRRSRQIIAANGSLLRRGVQRGRACRWRISGDERRGLGSAFWIRTSAASTTCCAL